MLGRSTHAGSERLQLASKAARQWSRTIDIGRRGYGRTTLGHVLDFNLRRLVFPAAFSLLLAAVTRHYLRSANFKGIPSNIISGSVGIFVAALFGLLFPGALLGRAEPVRRLFGQIRDALFPSALLSLLGFAPKASSLVPGGVWVEDDDSVLLDPASGQPIRASKPFRSTLLGGGIPGPCPACATGDKDTCLWSALNGKQTIGELWLQVVSSFPDKPAMGKRVITDEVAQEDVSTNPAGATVKRTVQKLVLAPSYSWWSFAEVHEATRKIGAGLSALMDECGAPSAPSSARGRAGASGLASGATSASGAGQSTSTSTTAVGPTRHVGIYADTKMEWMQTLIACATAPYNRPGSDPLVVVTAYATLGLDALAYGFELTGTRIIVCDESLLGQLTEIVNGRLVPTGSGTNGDKRRTDGSSIQAVVYIPRRPGVSQPDARAVESLRSRPSSQGGPITVMSWEDLLVKGQAVLLAEGLGAGASTGAVANGTATSPTAAGTPRGGLEPISKGKTTTPRSRGGRSPRHAGGADGEGRPAHPKTPTAQDTAETFGIGLGASSAAEPASTAAGAVQSAASSAGSAAPESGTASSGRSSLHTALSPRHAAAATTGPRTPSGTASGAAETTPKDHLLAAALSDPRVRAPGPQDLAMIMFTSGTTGLPKGVEILHGNLAAAAAGLGGMIPELVFGSHDVMIAYLPLAHVLEVAAEISIWARGAATGYANPRTLTDGGPMLPDPHKPRVDGRSEPVPVVRGDAITLQPTIMAGVPAVFDKITKGVRAKLAKAPWLARKLFEIAYRAKSAALECGEEPNPLWDWLIFERVRGAALSSRLRGILSGGGPISEDTQAFVNTVLGPCLQGYGLTETCGASTITWADDTTLGRVGAPVMCVELRLVDWPEGGYVHDPQSSEDNPRGNPRGEIYIGGPVVTRGYYHDPKKTREAYIRDSKGRTWFASGDIAEVHANGALSIIDRKKDLIKLSHGEYVPVGRVEAVLAGSSLVENLMVHGEGTEAYTVAIVVPSLEGVKRAIPSLAGKTRAELAGSRELEDALLKDFQALAKEQGLHKADVPAKVVVLEDEWTPGTPLAAEILTESLKLKRPVAIKKYRAVLDKLYGRDLQRGGS